MTTIVEIEILSDIIRFFGSSIKQNILQDQFNKILSLLNSRTDIPYDYLAILLAAYTKHYKETQEIQKLVDSTCSSIKEELPKKIFSFISIFNGNLDYFEINKKITVRTIKSTPKDQAVILLKSLGKIINKYKYFLDFDKKTIENTLNKFENLIESIILESDLFSATNNILDANLCVFILSLGYLQSYNQNENLFNKVFKFILGLIQQAKVNSQLLVNCLSLLVLGEITQTPDKESIIGKLETMDVSEDDFEVIKNFLNKIYYLYN
jgi:hypothetical protein